MRLYSNSQKIKRFKRDLNQWSVYVLIIGLLIGLPIYTIVFKLGEGPGTMWQHVVDNLLLDYLEN